MLAPQGPATGRPAAGHRRVINGILWKIRTGAPWRDLPERYGPWSAVAGRFRRWRLAGLWDRVFAAVQQQADVEGRPDRTVHFVDGGVIRAHRHAAGGKGGPEGKRSVEARGATRPESASGQGVGASPSPSS